MARIINYGSIDWKPKVSSTTAPSSFYSEPHRQSQSVDPEEKKREIMDKDKVWVTDPTEGFVLGRIIDLGESGVIVEPISRASSGKRFQSGGCGGGGGGVITTSYDRLYPAEEDETKEVDDNCGLMYLNEATLLNNIKLRYLKDKIYTYVANILVAINPYSEIKDLYSANTVRAYQGKSLGTMPPHVFAIADKAFRDMKVMRQSQSIIVSGESGAGKTESTKYILKYLCDNFGSGVGQLEAKILNSNPILEAFGNAKTTRNNNSSRFGKFIEIHFDSRYQVAGGYISHYLLERARIVSQSADERNYHIFYQLCAGASEDLRKKLHLGPPDTFRYLANGCTRYFCAAGTASGDVGSIPDDRKSADHAKRGPLRDPVVDDVNDFLTVDQDLKNLGMSEEDRLSVFVTIASVLHLGNITFEDDPEDNRGGCRITASSEKSLLITSHMMGLDDPDELRLALTARVMQASKGGGGYKGTVIMIPLKVHEASNARDALAKAIYSRLFDRIVKMINLSIPFEEKSCYYIGVLDIAGFEYFTVNSFEQFCINYCNEKLQQFFNQRILRDEQDLYEKEGLGVKKISFVDNQDCIHLIESVFSLLDEESKLPKPNHQHFTESVHVHNSGHFRIALPRKSKLREHREIRDDDGFLVRHFAGAVCYQTAKFIEKNNDALHASLEGVAQECKNPFIRSLFAEGQRSGAQKGKLTFISVGNKFKTQLEALMDKLRSTGTNFIRCIKPNVKMVAIEFEGGPILSQLQCAGMTSVLELMQQGYPSRTAFSELYNMYRGHMPADLARLDPRLFCKALFKALGLNDNDFKFGLTKVFFRPGKFAEFDQMLRSDPENLRRLVAKVKKWILASRWKKAQWCALSVIKLSRKIVYRRHALVQLQKNVRMYLARKRHAPRYRGIARMRKLQVQMEQIGLMSAKLKQPQQDEVKGNVRRMLSQLDQGVAKVKSAPNIPVAEIERLVKDLVDAIERELCGVKERLERQKLAEEREKLLKIEQEMEEMRKKKEAEEMKMKELEEEKNLKAEMEAKRKLEEEANMIERLKADKESAHKLQQALNEENKRLRQQIEQERRDHELALRLAAENNSVVMEESVSYSPVPQQALKRSSLVTAQQQARAAQKYDLSKWKYAELRDTINTSCDIELLESCREEFHRRLKVYHAWKAKNKKKNVNIASTSNDLHHSLDDNMRVPRSVLEEAAKNDGAEAVGPGTANSTQRYFKIPFVRPTAAATGGGDPNTTDPTSPSRQGQKGWWYAHFDGEWIGRQMELHPERKPVLLVAGKDDMQMCELALRETGLTRKRGAEILKHEFEKDWQKNGGQPYVRPAIDPRR